jgi:uncharacterized glyoxalase superfamily protein PhnB
MCKTGSTNIPGHRYRNALVAIVWLCTVFRFERDAVFEGENESVAHAQLTLCSGTIMLGSSRVTSLVRASNRQASWAESRRKASTR